MDLSSMHAALNRIQDIEYKVGIRRPVGGAASFRQMLTDEIKAKTPQRPGTAAAKGAQPSNPANRQGGTGSAGDAPRTGAAPKATAARETSAPADSAYYETIRQAAGKYGVDPKLVSAVAEVESGFQQGAVSATGAVGVMQLMPETAESLGVNPYDAAQNINGGAQYLKQMLDMFDGDVRKAVAAYNAGPEAVKEYGGVPPYSETQQYVSSVLDLYR
ncbi:MAG: lytic transglycosylase domain-containing protein [Schwartzia succinivorans]|nr:lytic transglycosylase domain-containing protein [Schwartzia succinivorans]